MKSISHLFTATRTAAMAAACFALVSCGGGSSVKGTYTFDGGQFDFDGSKVTEKMGDTALAAMPYTVDGKKIMIKNSAVMPGAPDDVLTINDDGSLDMHGVKLVKK